MNFETLLMEAHNKAITNKIVAYIGKNPESINEFLNLFNSKNDVLIQRASWPLGYIGELHPEIIIPHLSFILNKLDDPFHIAYKRNVFRFIRLIKQIPVKYHAKLIDMSLSNCTNPNNPSAVRAFAIQILTRYTILYPELTHEVLPVLESCLVDETPAIKNTVKHALIKINSIYKTTEHD